MACLQKRGLQRSDVTIVTLAPAQLVSAYTGGNGLLAGTWAPNTYPLNVQKANKPEFKSYLRKFFEANEVKLKDTYLANDMERPIYTLAGMLQMMSRANGKSTADNAFETLAGYLKNVGTITAVPEGKAFITDEHMRAVDRNAALTEFANKTN